MLPRVGVTLKDEACSYPDELISDWNKLCTNWPRSTLELSVTSVTAVTSVVEQSYSFTSTTIYHITYV